MLIYNGIISERNKLTMAKSGFRIALGVVKSIDREMKRSARAAEKRQRQQDSEQRTQQREIERRRKQAERERISAQKSLEASNKAQMKQEERERISAQKSLEASNKARIKATLEKEKDAYEERCKDRRILKEQFIDEEIK